MEALINLAIFGTLFAVAYMTGSNIEAKHFANIIAREKNLLRLPVVTGKTFLAERHVKNVRLVSGNVVIAGDYFKSVVAGLASVFGLRIAVAESLVDRARREAVLRLKEKAPDADIILNLRIDTMKIGDRTQFSGVEAMAYGTAIYYEK